MLLKKYSHDWINDFNKIKNEIEKALSGLTFSIEHVGSTAVANLDAKLIIDIDIIYSKQPDFEIIKSRLENIRYYHNGNQGMEDRDVFKRKGISTDNILDKIQHHLYVCPTNSKALERHILSRNFLRENDWARIKYQEMKYELAEKADQDKKVYAALKENNINDFIDAIIETEKLLQNSNYPVPKSSCD